MKLIGQLREVDGGRGAVRVEDVFDTDAADLWDACTRPERLARWIAEVSGDLRLGGDFRARFTTGWDGAGRVEVCEPPRRLTVVTRADDEETDCVLELTLTAQGARTTLTIEERGLPLDQLPAYGAGWQVHLEHLTAYLGHRPPSDLAERWRELIADYRALPVAGVQVG